MFPSHQLTVCCPNHNNTSIKLWFTEDMKKNLLTPYYILRGFEDFSIEGVDPKFAGDIASKIKKPLPIKALEEILQKITNQKIEGNEAYKRGDLRQAKVCWVKGMGIVCAEMSKDRIATSTAAGQIELIRSIHTVGLAIWMNLLHLEANEMRNCWNKGDKDVANKLAMEVMSFIAGTRDIIAGWKEFCGAEWQVDPKYAVKLLYREAMALRILGGDANLRTAWRRITVALTESPRDPHLLAEKVLIQAAMQN